MVRGLFVYLCNVVTEGHIVWGYLDINFIYGDYEVTLFNNGEMIALLGHSMIFPVK